jgi:prepilin-type N-terminal cleavage/methylation domain-containing protein
VENPRGFSLVEALVGLVILSMALAGALSFFIFGSQRATESFRRKGAEETLASVTSLITQDVQAAGFGLFAGGGSSYPQLALFVVNSSATGTTPAELYVNYSGYLSFDSSPQGPPADDLPPTCSTQYRSINSVFTRPFRPFSCGPLTLYYQGVVTLPTATGFTLYAVPTALSTSDIGAVITSGGIVSDATSVSSPGPLTATSNWTISFPSMGRTSGGGAAAIAAGATAAPAISYKDVQGSGTSTGKLLRNGVPIMGGDAYVDVNNFQVRCQFADGSWQTTNTSPSSLRMVEITISYRMNRGKGDQFLWSPTYTRTLRVAPRTVVLKQRVG